jgi:hypothetical protein
MSQLTAAQRQALYTALRAAFPTVDDLNRLIDLGLGERPDTIAAEGTLNTRILAVITWAEAHNRLPDLLRTAHADNSAFTFTGPLAGGKSNTPGDPIPPSTGNADLHTALALFFAALDELGNPELLTKARELRAAMQQDEPDVEHITEVRRWFAARPGKAREAAAAFFNDPAVRRIIDEATRREYGG